MNRDLPLITYAQEALASIEALRPDSAAQLADDDFRHQRAAVLYYLHTMAEAVSRLSDELKVTESEIDWIGIAGFRNRLVHGYLDVNISVVWRVLTEDTPPLKDALTRMVQRVQVASDDESR